MWWSRVHFHPLVEARAASPAGCGAGRRPPPARQCLTRRAASSTCRVPSPRPCAERPRAGDAAPASCPRRSRQPDRTGPAMGCARGLCTADKIFIFINIAFAMYSGALLTTAARLAWDPSTYTWFRFLCAAQYRVSAAYVLAAGLWLAALVYLAAAAAHRSARTCLHVYAVGVVCLALSEVAYGAWMVASLVAWWRDAPEAELARHGVDLLHDLKPALLAVERYRDVARPLYDMIEEVEREAPNNVFVIIVFSALGLVLQIAAFVMARRLARRGAAAERAEAAPCACACDKRDDDSDSDARAPPGWRKKANLRMYTILDKIF